MRYFCTYFDKNYLSRGLALYESLRAHHPAFRLFIGCFDRETKSYLEARRLAEVTLVGVDELEAFDPELAATKGGRTRVEYYFTSTAAWLRYVFARHAEVDLLTYVDSDFYFFASAEPLFAELGAGSIAVVEHRFPPALAHLVDRGRFNVGWLSFRRDDQGQACIAWWRDRCIEWCFDRHEPGRFADQKYLDEWPARYDRLVVLVHKGVSVAPWNLAGTRVHVAGGVLRVDADPLICFHFHGFKHAAGPLYASGLRGYDAPLNGALRERVYEPYLRELLRHEAELKGAGVTSGRARSARYVGVDPSAWSERGKRAVNLVGLVLSRTFLIAPLVGRARS